MIWCAAVSAVAFATCFVLVLLSRDRLLGISLVTGWIALLISIAAIWRLTRLRKAGHRGPPQTAICAAICVPVLGFASLSMLLLGHLREYDLRLVSSSNLRGISIGLRMYCEKEGVPPSSWDDLIRAGICTPGQFIRPFDPDTHESRDGKLVGSSYVYRRAAAACPSKGDEIIAYERLPWTPRDVRLFRRYCRQGITAAGKMQFLEEAEVAALRD